MVLCVCGTLGPPVAAMLVRVCACKRLCERSGCGVLAPTRLAACWLVCKGMNHMRISLVTCFAPILCARCCLYQAPRDVDVAVKAPAVSVVSEGGVLWGTESCAACVCCGCMQGSHMQPWTTRRGLLSSCCHSTYTLNPHILCIGYRCM